MNDDYLEKMKVVMKDAGWSQEQLAGKLGVSFASVNAWINGKSRPRSSMVKKINDLYLAKDVAGGKGNPIYITIIGIGGRINLGVGDTVILRKEEGNSYDDESIRVIESSEAEGGGWIEDDMEFGCGMYVANSVNTVARGTYSAGRIYDKLVGEGVACVEFVLRGVAIARMVEWGDE